MNTELVVGFTIHDTDARKLCKKLDMACEIRQGNFTFKYDGACTTFVAPRQLGSVPFRIAMAVLDGYRIGIL